MNRILSALEQIAGQLQSASGNNNTAVGNVLRAIGQIQSAMDDVMNNPDDTGGLRSIQSLLAQWNVDGQFLPDIQAGLQGLVHQVNSVAGTNLINEQVVSSLVGRLGNFQSQLNTGNIDPAVAQQLMSGIRQAYSQAESALSSLLEQVNLNNSSILNLLQKLNRQA